MESDRRKYGSAPRPIHPPYTTCQSAAATLCYAYFDVNGRLVRDPMNGSQTEGQKTALWDGRNNNGRGSATGTYFYRLTAPGFTQTRKMVLLK
jgi:flagellar hook assembly protein FlgD